MVTFSAKIALHRQVWCYFSLENRRRDLNPNGTFSRFGALLSVVCQ